ncbi:MAG: hypothetical protein N2Z22_06805 [Turneriella sp.]|nr:hypothetical protein [Turneriella sp.]
MSAKHGKGKISVIHGPMFSGKTEELLRRVRRAKIARRKVQLFKPAIDNRYHATQVLPHFLAHASDEKLQVGEVAHVVLQAREILSLVEPDTDLVAIEEAQFFDIFLTEAIRILSRQGKDVLLSLLDQDYRRLPFPIPGSDRTVGEYLAMAHESLKLSAICVVCGAEAHHSQKLVLKAVHESKPEYVPASYYGETVTVGTSQGILQEKLFADNQPEFAQFVYEARCRNCHTVPDEPES